MFGSKAAVWAYNRVGDALTAISTALLLTLVLHFVDDYQGAEAEWSAPSACEGFQTINSSIGMCMEEDKKEAASRSFRLLGAQCTFASGPRGPCLTIQSTERRKARMKALTDDCTPVSRASTR